MLPPLALIVLLLGAIYLYDRSQRDRVADGVRIDGIDVGGLSASQARAKVQRAVLASLERQPVTLRAGSRTWHITGREAALRIDAPAVIARALAASREGSLFARAEREIFGGRLRRNIPLRASFSHRAVRRLTAEVRAAIDRPAQDATVQPTAGGLRRVPSHNGVEVDSARLGAQIEHALLGATASRVLAVPTIVTRPKVTTAQLAAHYPAYIVVDRSAFTLRFYSHLKLASSYPIAVGMQGLETPPGLYHIQWKQVNPPWYVPNSAWAGSLAGKVIPPGPQDPLKARFMAFDGGAGIHGIDPSEYGTIGHDASHGCVRMRIPDVIALYSRTPVGTPVYIM